MRSAGNFNPEWGYLAPVPSFMRTARIVVVATAVGATAGAAVVLSLIEHPAVETNNTVVAAHAIVTSVQAATPPAMPLAKSATTSAATPAIAAAPIQAPTAARPVAVIQSAPLPTAGDASANSTAPGLAPALQSPPSVAALSAAPPETETAPPQTPDDAALTPPEPPSPKKTSKHAGSANGRYQQGPGFGTVLRHLFTAHAGPSYYPNRGN